MTRRQVLFVTAAILVVAAVVVRLDPPRAPLPERADRVGAQVHGTWSSWSDRDVEIVLDRLREAGIGWVRLDVGWGSLQPGGPDDWSTSYAHRVERVLDGAQARGLSVLVTFWRTPPWANGGAGATAPPDDAADYGRAAAVVAERWGDRVAAWEVWNEPNLDDFFTGTDPRRYVDLLAAAAPAFRAADPEAPVVLAGPAYNDVGWLRAVYEAGGQGLFDVAATHPYMQPADAPPDEPGGALSQEQVGEVRALMAEYGDEDVPLWFTELGWSTHDNAPDEEGWRRGVTPQEQASYLVQALEIAEQLPRVERAFVYVARAPDDEDAHQRGYGILTWDLEPKPAWHALRAYLRDEEE